MRVFKKLEICINSKENPHFSIYNELDDKFNEIAKKLEKYDILHDELNYFLLISDKILYIVHRNCENKHFGHYKFVLDLFDFFMEIWNAKLDLLLNYTPLNFEKHQNLKKEFNKKYFEFNKKFHTEIYEPDENYSEKEIYLIMEKMRND